MNMEDQNEELRQLGTTRFQFVYVSVDLILSYHNADQIALINTDAPCQGLNIKFEFTPEGSWSSHWSYKDLLNTCAITKAELATCFSHAVFNWRQAYLEAEMRHLPLGAGILVAGARS